MPAFGSISASTLVAQKQANVLCPTGTATGHLLLIFGCNTDAFGYLTPSGCTALAQPYTPGGMSNDIGSGVFYRFATSGDVAGSTSYAMNETGGTGGNPNIAVCVRVTGVDPAWAPVLIRTDNPAAAPPFTGLSPSGPDSGLAHGGGSTGTTTTGSGAACQSPVNPTSVAATDYVIRIYMSGDDAAATGKTLSTTAPAGWTARGNYISNVGSSKWNGGMIVCDRIGAVDTATVTTNRASIWDIYTIAIPAPPTINTGQFMPFFGGMGHHADDLEQRPSGLYVQRRRLAGVRSDGGRDRVLVHS
jgi:hypothetical protein